MRSEEGYIPVGEHKVWYRAVGSGGIPLLVLHGGPGVPHDYLENLEALASDSRRVVFYDQLGSGRSDRPSDQSLWRIERFVDEVDTVRRALGLDRCHLLGQSWGGMLAIEYALTRRPRLDSLVLANTGASVPQFVVSVARLRAALPQEVRAILDKHESDETTDDPEYGEAVLEFYRRHLCRLDPWPESFGRASAAFNPEKHGTMWGRNEFSVTGNLRDWDRTGHLSDIDMPTLIVCGRHDEFTPEIAASLQSGIPGSELVVFENSAHLPHVEEETLYLQTVAGFLARAEQRLPA